jgi:hypothetical protein
MMWYLQCTLFSIPYFQYSLKAKHAFSSTLPEQLMIVQHATSSDGQDHYLELLPLSLVVHHLSFGKCTKKGTRTG